MILLDIFVPGIPYPLKRPRVTKNGTYDPPENTCAKDHIRWLCRWNGLPHAGRVEVVIDCYYKRANPTADVDNLAKTVLDALQGDGKTGFVIMNDSQVYSLKVTKIANSVENATYIRVLEME